MALTMGCALAARAGLPISLVSGSGGQLSAALVNNEHVAALAFVGGKTNGSIIASSLYDRNKRYMLEMEGVNTWGIWNLSDWGGLAKLLKKGFEYGKQRCTAYPRLVIQRDLFPQFLAMYLPVLESLRFGHPLLVEGDGELPRLDFGPIINSKKVEELRVRFSEAKGKGGICPLRRKLRRLTLFAQPGHLGLLRAAVHSERAQELRTLPQRAFRPDRFHRDRGPHRGNDRRDECLRRGAGFERRDG